MRIVPITFSSMEKIFGKHVLLKLLVALLPTLVFLQDYAWMTTNKMVGFAFVILFVVILWSAWSFEDKNAIFERYFRLMEVGFFLMPLSALVMTFIFGSQAIISSTDGISQAGVAIGTAIGGTVVVAIAFVVGLTMGFVMHLVSGSYAKKMEHSKQPETFATKHGVILPILALIVLSFIIGIVSSAEYSAQVAKEQQALGVINLPRAETDPIVTVERPEIESQKVTVEITKKDFVTVDYQEQITMNIEFTNHTEKEIRGVEGVLTLYDIFDNRIFSITVRYDKSIPAQGKKIWESGIDYNQFIDEDVKLKQTALENLKHQWRISTIIYADGSKETL